MNIFLRKTIYLLISLIVLTAYIGNQRIFFQLNLANADQIAVIIFLVLIILLLLFDFYQLVVKSLDLKKESNTTKSDKKNKSKISNEEYLELIENQTSKIYFYEAKLKEINRIVEKTTDSEKLEKLENDRRKYTGLVEQEKLILETTKKNFLDQ